MTNGYDANGWEREPFGVKGNERNPEYEYDGPAKWQKPATTAQQMCPHCGRLVRAAPLVPTHDWPMPCRQVCPGSGQIPRCPESDARPLWNGEPNPHFGVRP